GGGGGAGAPRRGGRPAAPPSPRAGVARRCAWSRRGRYASEPGFLEQFADHLLGLEAVGRDLSRGLRVRVVVAGDAVHRVEDLVQGSEAEESAAGGHELAEARLLGDDRTPRGQIADAAVAEPARAHPHVLVLGHGELPARGAHVVPIRLDVSGDAQGIRGPPPEGLELVPPLPVDPREGQLERLRAAAGEVEELAELDVLAPFVELAVPF